MKRGARKETVIGGDRGETESCLGVDGVKGKGGGRGGGGGGCAFHSIHDATEKMVR